MAKEEKKDSMPRIKLSQGINPDFERFVSSAVYKGIETIIRKNPRLSGQHEFFMKYIDPVQLEQYFIELYEEEQQSAKKKGTFNFNYVGDRIASQVASGKFFNERGKEIVLRQGLERKAGGIIFGKTARELREGEKYLDKTVQAFREVRELMMSGDYAQRMPELALALQTIDNAGFYDTAYNILREDKVLDEESYHALKKALFLRTNKAETYVRKSLLGGYGVRNLENIAAAVFGIFGLGILLANSSITGNVIGVSNPSTNIYGLILGGLLCLFSLGLYARKRKLH